MTKKFNVTKQNEQTHGNTLKYLENGRVRRITNTLQKFDENMKAKFVISRFTKKLGKGKALNEEDLAIIYLLPEEHVQNFLQFLVETYTDYRITLNMLNAINKVAGTRDINKKDDPFWIKMQNMKNAAASIVDHVMKNKQNYPTAYAYIKKTKDLPSN